MSRVYLPRLLKEINGFRFVEAAVEPDDRSTTIAIERRAAFTDAMGEVVDAWVSVDLDTQALLRVVFGLQPCQAFCYDKDEQPYYESEHDLEAIVEQSR